MFSVEDCKREYVLDSIVYDISDTMQKNKTKKAIQVINSSLEKCPLFERVWLHFSTHFSANK